MKKVVAIVIGLGVLLALATPVSAWVTIETVPVGDPNNPDDTAHDPNGFGGVGYKYNIGKYEVTAGQYCEFLNAVADTDTYGLYHTNMDYDAHTGEYGCNIKRTGSSGSYDYSVDPNWAHRPVNWVSWGDAARFCNWLHNGQPTGPQDPNTTEDGAYYLNAAVTDAALIAVAREADWKWAIPTEDEWYKAAYYSGSGSTYYDYPTSSDTAPGYVNASGNLSGTGNPFTEGETDPGNYATYDGDGGTDGIGGPYCRTEVGEWENSASPYGTFDQGGNVWEWNDAILYSSYRGWRGGSFEGVLGFLHGSHRYTYFYPSNEYSYGGFRVAQVPEPTCLALLALGAFVLTRRRR